MGDVAERPDELSDQVAAAQRSRPFSRAELGVAAIIVAALAILGVGVGLLWTAISPHVAVVITADGPSWQANGGDEFFAGEGAFALLSIVLGLHSGIAVWFAARRWRGPILLIALVIGSLTGALIAWQVGKHVGLDAYRELLRNTDVGREFERPVEVRSKGMLLLQALSATATYLWLACWKVHPDLS